MRIRWALKLLLLLAFAAVLYFAARTIDWPRLGKEFASASPSYLALMVLAWGVVLFLRPLRMLLLLRAAAQTPWDYRTMWSAHILGMATNTVAPMRGGDVVMALIIRQRLGVSTSQGLSIVIVDRLCDLIAVCILFLGALVFLPAAAPWSGRLALALSVGLVVGFVALAIMVRLHGPLLAWLARRLARFERGARWHAMAQDLFSGLATFRTARFTIMIALLSAFLWGATVLSYWFGIRAVIAGVSPAAASFAVGAVGLSFVVPLAPGGIGVFQAAAVFALAAFGVAVEPALAFAIIAHALEILLVMVLAGYAFLVMGVDARPVIRARETQS
jgi:glycosyltransferase 2 family protein